MRRLPVLIALFALALAACSAGTADSPATSTVADGATTTSSVETTEAPPDDTESPTTTSAEVTTTLSDRPVAPDFTLDLGDGGSYTLSDDARPVYLVFWAEW